MSLPDNTITLWRCRDCGDVVYEADDYCCWSGSDDAGEYAALDEVRYVAVDALREKMEDGWSHALGEFDAAVAALTGESRDA